MKRFNSSLATSTLAILAIFLAFTVQAPAAENKSASGINQYVGLWEAVDPDDGGHQILSLTKNSDGKIRILLRDTYFTLCDGSDKGYSQGTGILKPDGSLVSDDLTLTCLETQITKLTPTSFKIDPKYKILLRDRAEPLSDIVYHRTSN